MRIAERPIGRDTRRPIILPRPRGTTGACLSLVGLGVAARLTPRRPASTMMKSSPGSAPSSRGPGHGPFTAATRVRIPSGSNQRHATSILASAVDDAGAWACGLAGMGWREAGPSAYGERPCRDTRRFSLAGVFWRRRRDVAQQGVRRRPRSRRAQEALLARYRGGAAIRPLALFLEHTGQGRADLRRP